MNTPFSSGVDSAPSDNLFSKDLDVATSGNSCSQNWLSAESSPAASLPSVNTAFEKDERPWIPVDETLTVVARCKILSRSCSVMSSS